MSKVLNLILFRNFRLNRIQKKLLDSINSAVAEQILECLLKGMSLVFLISENFRQNIKGFKGRYLFQSRDKKITASVIFDNNKMIYNDKPIDNANITITFKDGKALLNYIFSPKPDILNAILTQDITFNGNLNYLYKFAYMATRLRLMAERPDKYGI